MIRKAWWKSRTLRVNFLAAILAVVELKFQLLQPHLPINVYAALAFALPVLNAGLRFITAEPIGRGK